MSATTHGIAVLFGLALRRDDGLPCNAALLAHMDGRIERAAAKIHLPPAGMGERFGEADHFAPGLPEIGSVAIGALRVAALVCYDRRFPECWRAAAASGADLVAVLVGGPAPGDPEGLSPPSFGRVPAPTPSMRWRRRATAPRRSPAAR